MFEPKMFTNGSVGPRDVVLNILDLSIIVSEVELQSCYYNRFRTNILVKEHSYPLTCEIVPLLFFSKDSFKLPNAIK